MCACAYVYDQIIMCIHYGAVSYTHLDVYKRQLLKWPDVEKRVKGRTKRSYIHAARMEQLINERCWEAVSYVMRFCYYPITFQTVRAKLCPALCHPSTKYIILWNIDTFWTYWYWKLNFYTQTFCSFTDVIPVKRMCHILLNQICVYTILCFCMRLCLCLYVCVRACLFSL